MSANENEPMEQWLNEYTDKKVRSTSEGAFKIYLAWTKKTPKQLIDEFDQIKTKSQILQFQNYLINDYISPTTNKKIMPNSVRSILNKVRAFYSSQKEMIRGLKNKIIDIEEANCEHVFSIDDLRAMYAVGGFRDKASLA